MKEIKTYLFILGLSFFSAGVLSITTTLLRKPQEIAKESYRYKELLKAASITFQDQGEKSIAQFANSLLTPMLTDDSGNSYTFAEKNIDLKQYLEEGQKNGYSKLKYKIFYKMKNGGAVIPLNGYGLWDAIYGYIGIDKNGFTILGISWYDQKETPGLGGEIQNPKWQDQFKGKLLFHGNRMKIFGVQFTPKEMASLLTTKEKDYTVDAISGATITTNGVKDAIEDSLSPYIPLLKKMGGRK